MVDQRLDQRNTTLLLNDEHSVRTSVVRRDVIPAFNSTYTRFFKIYPQQLEKAQALGDKRLIKFWERVIEICQGFYNNEIRIAPAADGRRSKEIVDMGRAERGVVAPQEMVGVTPNGNGQGTTVIVGQNGNGHRPAAKRGWFGPMKKK